MPKPVLYMEPGDAEARGLSTGQRVRISSPANQEGIEALLETTNVLRPGMVDIHHGWPEANANALVPRDFDPISGFPPYKEGLCQVVAAQPDATKPASVGAAAIAAQPAACATAAASATAAAAQPAACATAAASATAAVAAQPAAKVAAQPAFVGRS
jgi:predicted molibdopterin-dependent oxidoreductase YjgC